MATVYYIPNAQLTASVTLATVTAVATGGTLTATINQKTITYTCTASDTATTAVAAWLTLLTAGTVPAEFRLANYTLSTNVLTATAATPGTPFTNITNGLTFTAAGGCTLAQTYPTANSSPSDVANVLNWLRNGFNAYPQNGDNLIFQDNDVPLLWNLDYFATMQPGTIARWQTQTGQIGLPRQNTAGFLEFRPQYFKFGTGASTSSSSGSAVPAVTFNLGVGVDGSGPTLEQWDFGSQQFAGNVLAGQLVRILGTNTQSVLTVYGSTTILAMQPAEVSSIQDVTVDSGGTLQMGPNVTQGGTLTLTQGTGIIFNAPPVVNLANGSRLTVESTGLTYPSVSELSGCNITWNSDSRITALVVSVNSQFDKSQDLRPMTIDTMTIDGDTCQVRDPNSKITYTNPVTVKNVVSTGPITFVGPKTLRIV